MVLIVKKIPVGPSLVLRAGPISHSPTAAHPHHRMGNVTLGWEILTSRSIHNRDEVNDHEYGRTALPSLSRTSGYVRCNSKGACTSISSYGSRSTTLGTSSVSSLACIP